MNNIRRKKISDIVSKLDIIKSEIEDVLYEEQEAYDNMTEGLKSSDKGMNSEDSISSLEAAQEYVENALDELNGIN